MTKTLRVLIILFAVSSLITINGCKKTSVNGKVSRKVSTTGAAAPVTTNFTYDSEGRLLTLQDNTGSLSYSYSANNIVVTSTAGGSNTYTLNPQGYVASNLNGTTFIYDNGYLTREANSNGNSISYTISNGDQQTETDQINGATTTYTFTYTTDVDYRDYGQSAFGKNNTHLTSSEIITSNGTSVTYNFNYTKDSQGRVIAVTIIGSNGTNIVESYTYTS